MVLGLEPWCTTVATTNGHFDRELEKSSHYPRGVLVLTHGSRVGAGGSQSMTTDVTQYSHNTNHYSRRSCVRHGRGGGGRLSRGLPQLTLSRRLTASPPTG